MKVRLLFTQYDFHCWSNRLKSVIWPGLWRCNRNWIVTIQTFLVNPRHSSFHPWTFDAFTFQLSSANVKFIAMFFTLCWQMMRPKLTIVENIYIEYRSKLTDARVLHRQTNEAVWGVLLTIFHFVEISHSNAPHSIVFVKTCKISQLFADQPALLQCAARLTIP